jgi:hypothetical protein
MAKGRPGIQRSKYLLLLAFVLLTLVVAGTNPDSLKVAARLQKATMFRRDDGVTVNLAEVTDTSLRMSLTWNKTTFGGGRSGSIQGKHEFVMSR